MCIWVYIRVRHACSVGPGPSFFRPHLPAMQSSHLQAFEQEAADAEAKGEPWAKEQWYGTVHKLERIPEVRNDDSDR